MTIIHAETTDGEQYLTVEGIKVSGSVRSIGFIYPTPTRWQRIRAFPRYVLYYTGLREAGIAEGPDIDALSAGPDRSDAEAVLSAALLTLKESYRISPRS